jgi:hypothetical protein
MPPITLVARSVPDSPVFVLVLVGPGSDRPDQLTLVWVKLTLSDAVPVCAPT